MRISKTHLPYFYEDTSQWIPLPNGVDEQTAWEYSVVPYTPQDMAGQTHPLVMERLRREKRYRVAQYMIVANAVDEWHYLEEDERPYSGFTQGYRGYWDGYIIGTTAPLPAEAAVMLGYTPDPCHIPPYIETVYAEDLIALLERAERLLRDSNTLNAQRPLPIGTPEDTPAHVAEIVHLFRSKIGLTCSRGKAAVLDAFMQATGIIALGGGWSLTDDEVERRRQPQV
ncbi:MAG: hypothetical protein OHK0046_04260 [Anaerolineae bacterium]